MSDYIRRADAMDAVPKERIVEYMDEFGAGYNSCRNDILRSIEALEPADVVSKVDITALLEETEKELAKGTDEMSIARCFIVSIMVIVKCKIMQMGEKKDG